MTLDDLNLSIPFRQRIEQEPGKIEMLLSAVDFFDTDVKKLQTIYEEDIKTKRYNSEDQFSIAMEFLHKHGHITISNYRESFIAHAANAILYRRHPLINIGTRILNWSRCYVHDLFLKQAHLGGSNDQIIAATLPLFIKDKDAIQALTDRFGGTYEKWKSAVRRFKKSAPERDKKIGSNFTE